MEVIGTVDVIVLEVPVGKIITLHFSVTFNLPNCPSLGQNIATDYPPNDPMPGVAVNFFESLNFCTICQLTCRHLV